MKTTKIVFISITVLLSLIIGISVLTPPVKAQGTSAQTVILSNESPGNGIMALCNAGYGNLSIFHALGQIVENSNPNYTVILTPSFKNALLDCPSSSPIFTTQLKDYSASNAIAISTDGTVQTVAYNGSTYLNTQGTSSLDAQISGAGNFRAVYNSTQTPITTFTIGSVTYNVFAIIYVPSTSTTPEFSPIMLLPLALAMLFAVVVIKRKNRF